MYLQNTLYSPAYHVAILLDQCFDLIVNCVFCYFLFHNIAQPIFPSDDTGRTLSIYRETTTNNTSPGKDGGGSNVGGTSAQNETR